MKKPGGGFALRTPADLLAKLRNDHERLKSDPTDSYAAFDFFVTALHMTDWVKAAGKGPLLPQSESGKLLLDICNHLANGLKHFHLKSNLITSTEKVDGAFDPNAFDPGAFDVGNLFIHLEGPAAQKLDASVTAVALAQRVFDHWCHELAAGPSESVP
jgi:hypothetical protein